MKNLMRYTWILSLVACAASTRPWPIVELPLDLRDVRYEYLSKGLYNCNSKPKPDTECLVLFSDFKTMIDNFAKCEVARDGLITFFDALND